MIDPLTAEEESQLSQYSFEQPSSSLLGRAGQQAVNLPSNIFTELSKLAFNVGIQSPEDTAPAEFPTPFDIPAPKGVGEGLIDAAAGLATSLPLFIAGEALGGGVGGAVEAGPVLANVARMAGAFGLSGLSKSPQAGALEGALGAGFGAVEKVPGLYKIPAAAVLGGVAAIERLSEKPEDTVGALETGAITAALPFAADAIGLLGKLKKSRAEVPNAGAAMPTADVPSTAIVLRDPRRAGRPMGEPFDPNFYGPPATTTVDPKLLRDRPFHTPFTEIAETKPPPVGGPPFGLEAERGGVPPAGSLIREPSLTADEALRGRKPVATSQFQLSGEPELDFPATPGVNGIPPLLPKVDTNGQKLLFAPEGSLVRDASITRGEVDRVLEVRKNKAAQRTLQTPVTPTPKPGSLEAKFAELENRFKADEAKNAVVTENARINPSRKVTNNTVLHSEDNVMASKAAKRLGMQFDRAAEPVVTGQPRRLSFTTLGTRDTIELPEGSTFADLKRALTENKAKYAVQDVKEAVVKDITTKPPELLKPAEPLTLEGAPKVSPRPEGFRKAVQYKGETFEGETHEAAIAKLEKRFPRYKETARKTEPIVRGYITPEGKFESNLLNIARREEAAVAAKVEEPVLDIEAEFASLQDRDVATLQSIPEVKATAVDKAALESIKAPPLPPTEVTNTTIKIGDSKYEIKKVGGNWTYEGMPLAKSKQAAIREIRKLHQASTSPNPSLEAAQSKLAQAAEGQRQVGDKVFVDFAGEPEMGTIVAPSKDGVTQVRLAGGDIVDILDRKITEVPSNKFEITAAAEEKAIGDLESFRKLEKDNNRKRAGLKLKRPTGEAGAIPADVARAIGAYVVGPVGGALFGAANSDEDHRLSGALFGLIAGGAISIGGVKVFELLAEGHPDVNIPGSYPAAVKATVKSVKEAVKDPHKEVVTASITGRASNTAKLLLWASKYLSTDAVRTRLIMRAHGDVETIAGTLHHVLPILAKSTTDDNRQTILDFFTGVTNYPVFEKLLNNPELAKIAASARMAADSLSAIVRKSLPEGKLKEAIGDNFGKYLTTSYRLFTEKKYFPTQEQIIKIAEEVKDQRSPLDVRIRIIEDEFKRLKAQHALYGSKSGASISGILFSRKDLSAAYEDALGIYKDPVQQLISTTHKLIATARSAEFINLVADGTGKDGLRFAYSEAAMSSTLNNLRKLKDAAVNAKNMEEVATLQTKIDKLSSYVFDHKNEAHGRLSDNFIERRMHDQLAQKDLVIKESNSYIARNLRDATTYFKYNKTVLSPVQFAKQIVNMPFLGLMSRTFPSDWASALKSLHTPEIRERLTRIGVIGGDIVGGMLRHDLDSLLRGNLEKFSFTNKPLQYLKKWEQLWRTPDLMVRVAAFQKKEAELLSKIGADLEPEARAMAIRQAEDDAIDYMNRYTMNYEVIPPGVRIFSNVPFANQFLTWVFEMTRITKNLAQDAIGLGPSGQPDLYAAGILASFAAAPFALQAASESMLSAKDKKDWEKVKGLLPDYARGNFVWVTHRDKQGHFHYINFTGIVIHDNYLKMFKDVMHGDYAAFKADNPIFGWENTPLLNLATNQMTGKDIHTKQTLRTMFDRVESARRDFAPPMLGTDFDRFVKALTPNAEGGFGITDARTGQQTDLAGLLLSYTTSLRGYSTDLSVLQQRALYDAKADIADQRVDLNRILRSNARADYKQRAVDRFQFFNKQILLELARQIRPDTAD